MPLFLDGKVDLRHGDCLEVIKTIPDASIDSVVTDPPYALVSIVKRFGKDHSHLSVPKHKNPETIKAGHYKRLSKGFMGKEWDTGDVAFAVEFWAEVYRVLKPGGHVAAFSGSRTYHRLAVAIEDAGFEIRDQLMYLYGSGFPKSHNVSKNLANDICSCEQAPKRNLRPVRKGDVSTPQHPTIECREVLQPGLPEQGAPIAGREEPANHEGCRKSSLERRHNGQTEPRQSSGRHICEVPRGLEGDGQSRRLCDGASSQDSAAPESSLVSGGMCPSSEPQVTRQSDRELGTLAGQSKSQNGGAWPHCDRCGKPIVPSGLGTALKPAHEPIVLARKPLIGTVAANVLEFGTGAINVDGCRIGTEERVNQPGSTNERVAMGGGWREDAQPTVAIGRWPANILHDGSDEVVGLFPETTSGSHKPYVQKVKGWKNSCDTNTFENTGDSGSAARFFYTAKADAHDRIGSKHPTVKPVDLMQWLCRLITPPGGTTLDPFAGTGTTGEAAFREGFKAILIERDLDYQQDIARRMALAMSGPDERARESIKAKGGKIDHSGTLFEGIL